jgi:hypothetical protein
VSTTRPLLEAVVEDRTMVLDPIDVVEDDEDTPELPVVLVTT